MCPDALSRIDFSRVLVVVSSNLYGIPNPLAAYEDIARSKGVLMLDDAAQAIGARIGGRAVGAFGDAGLYSFDKGKIICTIQGGAIVANDGALATAIDAEFTGVPPCPARDSATNAAKLLVYAACLHPAPYGLIRRLPFLGLGRTEYHTPSPETRLGALQTGMAAELMQRAGELNAARRATADGLRAQLQECTGLVLPSVPEGAEPVYARFPVRVRDAQRRAGLVEALEAAGIGATVSYPSALPDVPEVRGLLRSPDDDFPGARELARQIVTLPTHGYCPPDLGSRVRGIVRQCLSPAASVG
jgi:dTDP-4-amino-4,6-dideoxygalactose transaminase